MTLYTAQAGNPESRSLDMQATLQLGLAIPASSRSCSRRRTAGMLARLPLGSGAPREVAGSVRDAAGARRRGHRRGAHGDGTRPAPVPDRQACIYQPSGFSATSASRPPAIGSPSPNTRSSATSAAASRSSTGGQEDDAGGRFEDVGQVAWSPDGKEVWFSGPERASTTALFAVTLSGQDATAGNRPGHFACRTSRPWPRHSLARRTPPVDRCRRPARPRNELGWMDYSSVDMSDDGRTAAVLRAGRRRWARLCRLPPHHRRLSGGAARQG